MSKCTYCNGDGCEGCGKRGYISDCAEKEHWAKVRGKTYPLVLDPGSRNHRFPGNRIVRDVLDAAQEGKKFGLTEIAGKQGAGDYTLDEIVEFYTLIGYSTCGLGEVFTRIKIETCEWKT
ncbi:MAG TPA: hypothetical protein VN851_07075 [Thermoanaerobaculia bacterium]|jgi:hypothetical protein|nr:hypothetical protein [Thermoanaerobaculia bacterium]